MERYIGEATHQGMVCDYTDGVFAHCLLVMPRGAPGEVTGYKFIPVRPAASQRRPAQRRVVYVRDDGNKWVIPGTCISYNKIDGEMSNPDCCENFHPTFLELDGLSEL